MDMSAKILLFGLTFICIFSITMSFVVIQRLNGIEAEIQSVTADLQSIESTVTRAAARAEDAALSAKRAEEASLESLDMSWEAATLIEDSV
jgi:CHASE3 domain sensor protein